MAGALNVMDLEGIANREIASAIGFQDATIRDRQIEALKRYYGEALGNEVDGQSKVVTRDVLEAVEWIMPPLMRIFAGASDAVEFVPHGPEDEETAKQATDYVSYIYTSDNDGYRITYNTLKDGLLNGCGVAKVYYEMQNRWSAANTLTGLDDIAFSMLVNDPAVEVMEHTAEGGEFVGPDGIVQVSPVTHSVTIRHKITEPKFCVEAIAPEEFFISADAKGDIEIARCIGHRTQKTCSELIEMGFPKDVVDDLPKGSSYDWRSLERATPNSAATLNVDDPADDSQQYVWVSEAYIKADVDGDGISECVRVLVAGESVSGKLLSYELVDGHPFAFWTPLPMPHEQYGLSIAELVLDVQNVKTSLLRQTLNNLYLTNSPIVGMLEGSVVNTDALIDRKPGSVVVIKRPDALSPQSIPFTAAASFEMMSYWDAEGDKRTGVSGAQGLDPNLLQNTTAAGISAVMSASQQRIEMIARHYAEFMRAVFKKLLELVVKHQNKARVIRLRNKWVTIDPRFWSADMDAQPNVGLGNGNKDVMARNLAMIAAKQEMIMQVGGMDNPLVGLQEYRNTLAKMVEAVGFKNTEAFFKDPAMQPPQPPKPPQPDPKLVEVQSKASLEQQKADREFMLEQQKLEQDMVIARERLAAEMALAEQKMRYELELARAQREAEYRLKTGPESTDIRFGGELG